VPVIARGDQFVLGHDLAKVAEFVGVPAPGHTPLPPGTLIAKWIKILAAARRYARQFPPERLNARAIESRNRSIRILAHHVFRIGEAFLECVIGGVEYSSGLVDLEPEAGRCETGDEIADYGGRVIDRLQQWWDDAGEASSRATVQTFYGQQSVHQLLERSTWHSAQHVRQLTYLLDRDHVVPDGRLADEDLAGLPLPDAIFE